MLVEDLGQLAYRQAWAAQEESHAVVLGGGEERVLLVEHPPVITFGRRPGGERNVLASPDRLTELGVELVQSDRGGDVTFHGPGQVVAYPIIRLIDHRLSVGTYVQKLEDVVIAALAHFGVTGEKDASAIGIWVDDGGMLAKVCALGVRIRRGVTLHGVALNVSTDLAYFQLINPCGLGARPVTSLDRLLGDRAPRMEQVKEAIAREIQAAFGGQSAAV